MIPRWGIALAAGLLFRLVRRDRRQSVPFTGRKHAILIPEPVERALGETTFARMMAGKRRLPESDPRSQRVARLGARLARIAMAGDGGKGYVGHLADCAWRFVVVADPEINACALPGGKVVVNSGLCDAFEGDDEALAFVIAHEIGHVVARHSAEQLTAATAVNLIATVAQAAAAANGVPGALDRRMAEGIEGLLDMGLFRPRSREQEFEADHLGTIFCKQAGYSANGCIRVFQCFDALTRSRMGGAVTQQQQAFLNFLSTHPTPRDRAIAVREREEGLALAAAR